MRRKQTTASDTGRDRGSASDDGLVDRVVARCLAEAGRHSVEILESACRAHPEHADCLREQYAALRRSGLLGPVAARGPSQGGADGADGDGAAFDAVGPYQPLRELGRGGQAVVYLAEDVRLHRPVALKILQGLGALSETVLRRFRREAEVASRLDHPGICTVYDAGVIDGTPYLAMRYVEGVTLADAIREARKHASATRPARPIALPGSERSGRPASRRGASRRSGASARRDEIDRILVVVEKAARALDAAHEAGIVHRDVKPSNIMVTPGGEPVILDFGLAGAEDSGLVSLTRTGDLLGTPAYLSPEQLMARRIRLDRRTDVYSLGVTLFECLTLQRPFRGATREALYQAIQFKAPADVRKLNEYVPHDLKVVLDTTLEKDRDRRYQTALDLAEDLRRVRESEPTEARPVGNLGRFVRWAKRRPAAAILSLVLVLGLPLVTGLTGFILANRPAVERAARAERDQGADAFLAAGFSALGRGALEAADEAFGRAVEVKPVESVAGRALVWLRRERYAEARDWLRDHAELERDCPDLGRFRALALRRLDRDAEAARLIDAIGEPPDDLASFLAGLARMHEAETRSDERALGAARDDFLVAVQTAPRARMVYHVELARAVGRLGDAARAPRVADALVRQWGEDPDAWFWAGAALHDVDAAAAIRHYRGALERRPRWFDALARIAAIRDEGHLDEAIRAGAEALELKPDAASVRIDLARAHLGKGEPKNAVRHLLRASEALPRDTEARRLLGRALSLLDRAHEAADVLREAVRLAPDDARAAIDLARALVASGAVEDALDRLRALAARHLDRGDVHHALGRMLLYQEGTTAEAVASLEKALALDDGNPAVHRDLAVACVRQGRFADAVEAGNRARAAAKSHAEKNVVATWTNEAQRLAGLRSAIDAWLARDRSGLGPDYVLTLARICFHERRDHRAAELFREVFARADARAEARCPFWGETYRHLAARAAAAAGRGVAKDARRLTRNERAGWRQQACKWLERDLGYRQNEYARGAVKPAAFRARLVTWTRHARLAVVRDDEVSALPPEERRAFKKFWSRVDGVLASLRPEASHD